MKRALYPVLAVSIFCLVGQVFADPVAVPNTFQSGQPALASEVNENFSVLQNAVNSNRARIPVLKDGTGQVLGTLIDTSFSQLGPYYTIINDHKFVFSIVAAGTILPSSDLLYTSLDCTGTAYTFYGPGSIITHFGGFYYVPSGSSPSPVTIASSRSIDDGNCYQGDYGFTVYFALQPNDPVVTGISSDPVTLPLTIDFQ